MEGVGVYVATIHDKNAFKQFQIKPWSLSLVFDPILLYVFSLTELNPSRSDEKDL